MISLDEIKENNIKLMEIAKRYRASNLRAFGSVARGESTQESDIDLLVSFSPGATLLDQVGLTEELSELFHCPVDVVSDKALNRHIAEKVLNEAIKL